MASNDSGLDSSNDSNDGGAAGSSNAAIPPPSIIWLPMVNSRQSSSPPRLSPTIPPLPANVPTSAAIMAERGWHNINPKAFDLTAPPEAFAIPYTLENPPIMSIRPSSLPSGSHSYKMRFRNKQRIRNNFPCILAEANGRKLRTAASTCNIELLTRILESGSDPNSADEYKRCPLHLAASRGYIEIVQQLLRFGANPNVFDSRGNTPLHLAVISASSNNFNVVVRVLLQGGATVDMRDRSGKTPLDLAESKLRLLRTRYNHQTPESSKILEDMCVLVTLILRYMVKQRQELENLDALEKQLENLSTSDKPPEEQDMSQAADALLANVERLSLEK